MNLDLVLGLAGAPESGKTTNSGANKAVSSVLVIDRRVTIVISLVNCRATEAVGSSDAKISATRSCSDAWASSNRHAP